MKAPPIAARLLRRRPSILKSGSVHRIFHTISRFSIRSKTAAGNFCLLALCGFGANLNGLHAQADTLLALPSPEITAQHLRRQPAGAQSTTLDSTCLALHQTENVADALWKKSGMYVKSYGLGSLATTSARGGSAGQTAIVWNGLPLQSPMLGQLDFSLLPLVFVDEMTLQYGGNSAGWGSGAIGGAVLLENKSQFITGLSARLNVAAGSFGWQHHATTLRYGNGRWAGSTRIFFEKANNDFTFQIHPDLPETKQEHAALQQQGVLQEFFLKTRPNEEFALRVWLQDIARQIPPTIVQNRSQATQADALLRTTLHWKKTSGLLTLQTRAAFFTETLDYRDPLIGQASLSKFHTWMGEAEATRWLGRQSRLQGSVMQTYTRASTPAYEASPRQTRTAVFLAMRREGHRWQAQLDGRMEWVDGRWVPFTPSVGAEAEALRFLEIKGKIARNYRLPTFNDLYWRPGGNPELLPESGWSQDVGLVFHGKAKQLRWSYSATGFHRRIRNWLLWARKDGQFFFSPQNIAEVWSRGIESRLDVASAFSFGEIILTGGHDWVRSTNELAVSNPRIEQGAQLFYVPTHRVFAEVSVRVKHFQITGFQQFTEKVTGINEDVPSFSIGSLRIQYARPFGDWNGAIFLHIENLWDADYQVIERRPMPGRHFRLGFNAGFSTRKHTNSSS
ncbi:MAG: TonB-dependent receptor [Saprospiraceae bacterium]|nr:TonB-dependent receptor [Saprospiraceae bacterium]